MRELPLVRCVGAVPGSAAVEMRPAVVWAPRPKGLIFAQLKAGGPGGLNKAMNPTVQLRLASQIWPSRGYMMSSGNSDASA